jgi:hypothetical protein
MTGHQGQSTRLTPVVSPVKLAGPYDPSQSPEFKQARMAVGIAFERVGYMVPKEKVGGMLIVVDDDRMVLLEASATSPETGNRQYLVRCKNREAAAPGPEAARSLTRKRAALTLSASG